MLRRVAVLAVLAAFGLTLVACGSGSADDENTSSSTETAAAKDVPIPDDAENAAEFEEAVPGSGEGVKIGYITIGDEIPFVKIESDGIRQYAKEVGADLVTCDSELDASKALSCARTLKTQNVEVVLNQQLDAKASPEICAAGPEVPTIAIDVEQKPCEVSFMGSDNSRAGKLGGEAMGEYMKDNFDCEIDAVVSMEVVAAGQVNTDRAEGALSGFESFCGKQDVRRIDAGATIEDGRTKFADVLTSLPGAKRIVVFTINDDPALGVMAAAKAQGREEDIFIAAQSGSPLAYCPVANSPQFISVAYFPERYAQIVIPWAIRAAQGEEIPKKLLVPHIVLTQENIGEYYDVSGC